jgi:hypothetical protein
MKKLIRDSVEKKREKDKKNSNQRMRTQKWIKKLNKKRYRVKKLKIK